MSQARTRRARAEALAELTATAAAPAAVAARPALPALTGRRVVAGGSCELVLVRPARLTWFDASLPGRRYPEAVPGDVVLVGDAHAARLERLGAALTLEGYAELLAPVVDDVDEQDEQDEQVPTVDEPAQVSTPAHLPEQPAADALPEAAADLADLLREHPERADEVEAEEAKRPAPRPTVAKAIAAAREASATVTPGA